MQETIQKHWNLDMAIKQIQECGFECEGGPLANNEAWKWLVGAAKVGPKFWPGQGVYYKVTAQVKGVSLSKWEHFYIVGCRMDSGTDDRFWLYALSNDPPAPYHYGEIQFSNIKDSELKLEIPVETTP